MVKKVNYIDELSLTISNEFDLIESDDEKVIYLKTKLLELEKINDKIELIRNLIYKRDAKIRSLIAYKRKYNKAGDFSGETECRIQIKKIKSDLNLIRSLEIVKEYAPRNENKTRRKCSDFLISKERVIKLEQLLGTNYLDEILNFLNIENLDDRVLKLEEIKQSYLSKQYILRDEYKNAIISNDLEKASFISELKHTKSLLLSYLDDNISHIHSLMLSGTRKIKDESKIFEIEKKLTEKQMIIRSDILEQNNLDYYDLSDLLFVFKNILLHEDLIVYEISISNFMDYLLNRIDSLEKEEYIYSIINSLKIKKKNLGKEKCFEKKLIKKYIDNLETFLLILDDTPFYEEDTLNYEIISYFIKRPNNFYYIKNLIARNKNFVNLRHLGKHIIIDILELYFASFKTELRAQERNYINKEYYMNLYNLFRKNEFINLFQEDLEEIDNLYDQFLIYLQNKKYDPVLKESSRLAVDKFLYSKSVQEKNTDMKNVEEYLDDSVSILPSLAKGKNRISFDSRELEKIRIKIEEFQNEFYERYNVSANIELICEEFNISERDYFRILNYSSVEKFDNKYSYSTSKDSNGNLYLMLHVLDMTAIAKEMDVLDCYYSDNIGINELDITNMKVGKSYPTITYELKIYPNGYVGDLDVYQSRIFIDDMISNFDDYKKDTDQMKYIDIYRRASKDKASVDYGSILKFFEKIYNNAMKKFISKSKVPVILTGVNNYNLDKVQHEVSDLGSKFSRLNKTEYELYDELLSSNLDEVHYCNFDFSDGDYKFEFSSCNDYVDLFNQRVILSYISNDEKNIISELKKESDKIVDIANENIGYVKNIKFVDSKKVKKRK